MGASPLPVSLRNKLASPRARSTGQLLALNLNLLRNIVFILFLLRWTRKSFYQLKGRGIVGSTIDVYLSVRRTLYKLFLRAPGVRSQVEKQVTEAISKLESKLVPQGPGVSRYLNLPKEGWTPDQVRAELEKLGEMEHTRWEDGRVSGAVYHGGKEMLKIQAEAFERFGVANPIHPDVFPGVRKMEAEIVAMVLALFNAPPGGAGVTTSGGTESILMSIWILPSTAHTAFHKAASYFKIKIHLVDCPAPSYKVHIPSVSRLINPNTIVLVGSAPNFPHGIVDDISGLSRLALKHRLPLHVDCCLGSFMMPFLTRAGFQSPEGGFDFRVPGVTQISVDTHKYGFAPKGNSVVLYRTKALRSYQYFVSPDWSGGVYASPNIAGSRPGALIAGCWASLMLQGETGYVDACHAIVGAAKEIETNIRENEVLKASLSVIGEPLVSVVAFTSVDDEVDVYDVADAMSAKGWHLNAMQSPPAIHVAVTMPVVKAVDKLVADLVDVVEAEKEKSSIRSAAENSKAKKKKGDAAALYGVAGSLPDKSIVVKLAEGFLDTLYLA